MAKIRKIFAVLMLSPLLFSCSKGNIAPQIEGFESLRDRKAFVRNPNVNTDGSVKNVIMFIGDGMGYNQVGAAGLFNGAPLSFANPLNSDWTYHALVNTDSLTSDGYYLDETKSLIHPDENSTLYDTTPSPYGTESAKAGDDTCYTDSAAGGTALATGYKTINGRIGKDKNNEDLQNISEIAHKLGKKVGVVTTDKLDGATPSDYLVHAEHRYNSSDILNAYKTSVADLIIAEKPDSWDEGGYTAAYNGYYNVVFDQDNLGKEGKQLLLHSGHSYLYGEKNTLANQVAYALDYLDNEEGFFLMVEGAHIDKRAHANELIPMLEETVALDRAIKVATEWAAIRGDTIMCVSADHETGGFFYDYDATDVDGLMSKSNAISDYKCTNYFKSTNHSRARVRLDVYGDISDFTTEYAEQLKALRPDGNGLLEDVPYWDNTWIFNLCCSYL